MAKKDKNEDKGCDDDYDDDDCDRKITLIMLTDKN